MRMRTHSIQIRHTYTVYTCNSAVAHSAMSAEGCARRDESGTGRVRWDERGAMSAVAMANTALAHDAQLLVCKRSAWRTRGSSSV